MLECSCRVEAARADPGVALGWLDEEQASAALGGFLLRARSSHARVTSVSLSTEALIAAAYRYFPRGISEDDPQYRRTQEWLSRENARVLASADYEIWRTMLRRLQSRFPIEPPFERMVENRSLFMQSPAAGPADRCFTGALWLPVHDPERIQHELGFAVSFVVPYYVVHSSRTIRLDPPLGMRDSKREVSFELSALELPFAKGIVEEIESSFPGHTPMPPEVGNTIVPDVCTDLRGPGEATLFDCLFSDSWTPRP